MKIFSRFFLCLLSLWLTSSPVLAGSLDKAIDAYSAGDFKKAIKLGGKAAKKAKGKTEKAEAYALVGAATVKKGSAAKGKAKFVKALKLDPNITVPDAAAGDAKVEKAFASAQKKAGINVSDGGSVRGSDSIKKGSSKADKSAGNLKNYLPFGLNNFLQGKTITGVVTGGAQVFGFLLFLNRQQAITSADKDAQAVIAEAEANAATGSPEFLQFLADNDAFVKKAAGEANIALLAMMAGYGVSVVDALFDPLGTAKSAFLDGPSESRYANLGSEREDRTLGSSWKLDLQVLPSREPSMFLSLKQTF